MQNHMDPEREIDVVEVVPGEYDVTGGPVAGSVRVLVPPGVGVPGVAEDDLVGALVAELVTRGRRLHGTVDVSGLLRNEPDLLDAAAARIEDE